MDKFCYQSYLRVEIEALKCGNVKDWKESNLLFFPCWKKANVPFYKTPVKRLFTEDFYDICLEAWSSPIPSSHNKRTDEDCGSKVCDWTNKQINGIEVNISSVCNANCRFCGIYHFYSQEIEDLYFKCLESLKNHNIKIGLSTCGEPFANKNRLFSFLKGLNNEYISLVTNSLALTENDAKTLVDLCKTNNLQIIMSVSINGDSEESLSKMERVPVHFDRLKKVLDILNKGDLIKCVTNVIMPDTTYQIPHWMEFLESVSPTLSSHAKFLTNLNITSDDAEKVIASKEWQDFFHGKLTMSNVPLEVIS